MVVDAAAAAAVVAPAGKVLSEAELTKLAVAAMKAKLKGDKATHARLTEEVRFVSFRFVWWVCCLVLLVLVLLVCCGLLFC